MRISTLKQMPDVAKAVVERDNKLEAFTKDFISKGAAKDAPTYIIPVVFHVIHNYGPENISEEQIYDGIDVLNKTFRKLLADTATVVADFKPIHADTKIEFRLATKDPDGNCHSGINRIASSLTTKGDHSVKSLIHWPPNKYLNIYVVINAAGLAGHCVWPADADTIPEWDGIVVGYSYVGSIETADYTRSVALAHECGHYLNLHHIWGGNNVPNFYYLPCGDPNKDCNIDDLVADTPPTIGWQSCNLNASSCGSARDNVQNVMDYSYCNRMFTYGQRDRMHACLNSPIAGRNNLWSDANLIATGVKDPAPLCEANFKSDRNVICLGSGNKVKFTNLSFNKDAATYYKWEFDGGNPSTSNLKDPEVSYSLPGNWPVSLTVANATDTVTINRNDVIQVLTDLGNPAPYAQGFETVQSIEAADLYASTLDEVGKWEIGNVGYNSNASAVLYNFGSSVPTIDQLYGPPVDLSGQVGSWVLQFDYAYGRLNANDATQLNVYFAGNCNSGWQKRSQISGTSLGSAPNSATAFTPADASQWKSKTVTIPSNMMYSNLHYRIEVLTTSGNNLYIDNIKIQKAIGISEIDNAQASFEVFPIPAANEFTVNFELENSHTMDIILTNVTGQEVYKRSAVNVVPGKNAQSIRTDLPAGMYFLQLHLENGLIAKPVIIN